MNVDSGSGKEKMTYLDSTTRQEYRELERVPDTRADGRARERYTRQSKVGNGNGIQLICYADRYIMDLLNVMRRGMDTRFRDRKGAVRFVSVDSMK